MSFYGARSWVQIVGPIHRLQKEFIEEYTIYGIKEIEPFFNFTAEDYAPKEICCPVYRCFMAYHMVDFE
jgi:hypothetical protein